MSVFDKLYQNIKPQIEAEECFRDRWGFFITESVMENNIINSIRYDGEMPPNMPFWRNEQKLYWHGVCAYYKDDNGMLRFDIAVPCGALRQDGFYTKYQLIRLDGTSVIRNYDDIVLCFNCPSGISSRSIVLAYAERWNNATRAVDTMLERASLGEVVYCSTPSDKGTIEKAYNPEHSRVVEVTSDPAFAEGATTRQPLYDAREAGISELRDIADWYKNSLMNIFGFSAMDTVKRAQITADEVNKNDDQIVHGFFDAMLFSRNTAFDDLRNRGWLDIHAVPNRGNQFLADYHRDADDIEEDIETSEESIQSNPNQNSTNMPQGEN